MIPASLAIIGGDATGGSPYSPVRIWRGSDPWVALGSMPWDHQVLTVDATSEDNVWCGLDLGSSNYKVLHWDGASWSRIENFPSNPSGNQCRTFVYVYDEQTLFVVATQSVDSNHRVYRSLDNGASWSIIRTDTIQPGGAEGTARPAIVSPDLVYWGVYSGFLSGPGLTGFVRWTPGGGWEHEQEANGLPNDWHYYHGVCWDRSDPNDIWLVGYKSGQAARLYNGKWGGPWTLVDTFSTGNGYSQNFTPDSTGIRVGLAAMDSDGQIAIRVKRVAGGGERILYGDPRTTLPLPEVFSPGGTPQPAECDALGGAILVGGGTGGDRGWFYDGTTWSKPDANGWAEAQGCKILSAPPILINQLIDISSITVISLDLIRLNFNNPVAVTTSLLGTGSYSFSGGLSAKSILPIADDTTREVYLVLNPKADPKSNYIVTIPSAGNVSEVDTVDDLPNTTIYNPDGEPLRQMIATWRHHRTKVDVAISNLAGMYDLSIGSNLRMILQAIMISDEEIGGSF